MLPPDSSKKRLGVTSCKFSTLISYASISLPLTMLTLTLLPTLLSNMSSRSMKCVTVFPLTSTSTSPGSSLPSDGPPGTRLSTTSMPTVSTFWRLWFLTIASVSDFTPSLFTSSKPLKRKVACRSPLGISGASQTPGEPEGPGSKQDLQISRALTTRSRGRKKAEAVLVFDPAFSPIALP